jgi:hypothetical protein
MRTRREEDEMGIGIDRTDCMDYWGDSYLLVVGYTRSWQMLGAGARPLLTQIVRAPIPNRGLSSSLIC